MNTESTTEFEVRIRPNTSWFHIDVAGLRHYRDLLWLLVRRDFTSKYKQTILGPLWFLVNPLINAAMMTVIFVKALGVPTDGAPPMLFYLTGQLGWVYFSTVLGSTANSLAGNTHLFAKVYFPRLIPPLAVTVSSVFALIVQVFTFLGFYAYHVFTADAVQVAPPSVIWLYFPLIVLHMAVLGLGVGLIFSAVSAKYRDLQHIQGYIVNLLMYVTPVIYPLSRIPERWHWLAEINPMTPIVESMRYILLGAGTISSASYIQSAVVSVVVFLVGIFAYQKSARTFVDTV